MAKMIYIVTEGCYSDYSIKAVFSTRTKADEYVFNVGGDVEEWDVDTLIDAVKRKNYRYFLPSGESWDFDIVARPQDRTSPSNSESVPYKLPNNKWAAFGDSLVSFEHAKKLAEEKIQAALRRETEKGATK